MAPLGTLTRADLSEALHREIGLSRADSAQLVEQILEHMCAALAQGENVKISGFGTFVLRDKGERVGRNPKTGVEVPIAPRRVLTFRASQTLRDRIVHARLAQAFGRLIRRADDRGCFVLLSAAMPSRLLSAFPEGTPVHRISLAEAEAQVARLFTTPPIGHEALANA